MEITLDFEVAKNILFWLRLSPVTGADCIDALEERMIAVKQRALIGEFAYEWCLKYVREKEMPSPGMAHIDWSQPDMIARRAGGFCFSLFWSNKEGKVVTQPNFGTGGLPEEDFQTLLRDVNEMMSTKTREDLLS